MRSVHSGRPSARDRVFEGERCRNDALALEQLRHLVSESSSTVLPGLPPFKLVEQSLLLNDARIILAQMKAAIMLVIKQPLQPLRGCDLLRCSPRGGPRRAPSRRADRENAGAMDEADQQHGPTEPRSHRTTAEGACQRKMAAGLGVRLECHRLLPHHQM